MNRFILKIQYLGFRYHGWLQQPQVKTIQGQLDKTLRFIFPEGKIRTLSSGRTDAMVSALEMPVLLLLEANSEPEFIYLELSKNLPQDIKILSVHRDVDHVDIINDVQVKEYHYLFSNDEMHPFCAGMMTHFCGALDISLMQKAAKYFEGQHWLGNYCHYRSKSDQKVYARNILCSQLLENDEYTANFFPERSYLYRIKGKGFMHHQVRMMVGAMVMLGQGVWKWQDFLDSLQEGVKMHPKVAPASGLLLKKVEF